MAEKYSCSQSFGCLGACGQAPNAGVVKKRRGERLFTRVTSVEKSADIIAEATGRAPDLDDEALRVAGASVTGADCTEV